MSQQKPEMFSARLKGSCELGRVSDNDARSRKQIRLLTMSFSSNSRMVVNFCLTPSTRSWFSIWVFINRSTNVHGTRYVDNQRTTSYARTNTKHIPPYHQLSLSGAASIWNILHCFLVWLQPASARPPTYDIISCAAIRSSRVTVCTCVWYLWTALH